MATYNTAARNSNASDTAAKYNRLSILDGAVTLVTFSITWGSPATGVISVASTPVGGTAVASGTADGAKLHHSTGSEEVTGFTVGTSATDVILDSLTITNGQAVNLNSFAYTAPTTTD